ncbi:succinate dehydrogenase cytochrome b small subunit [Aspergillus eucalypticola CBS 122712]|uniref:Succinate dehydrogenase cytochrome b small subunit n=1 Tax=Aspergillus eucalypticola (strain CBS 122712 / IBT 29274) TaxID=1448314 RepID=A0A317VME5_ASPEC|nr:succinate dehydrogenase cytochrome b small subunit [Aspergillus eucalypticola CBS 122712]PWY74032.1 succinate dehydrogenase cytochrome b small subunit [Aspergillus eucalypticola CBS 122712]
MYPNTSLILTNIPTGLPTPHKDLTPLPRPLDITTPPTDPNTLLTKLLYASLDPYMRGRMRPAHIKSYSPPYPLNSPITAFAVAQVVHSTHASFKPGEIIYARLPIQEYSVLAVSASPAPATGEAGSEEEQLWMLENSLDGANSPIRKIPTPLPSGIELSQYVGILGMTGLTAYAGLFEIGEPKKGETVFVSSAAGAVGSVVGQLAKRIGLACGMVSQYNLKPEERYGVKNLYNVVTKRLRMRGFIVGDKDMGPKWIKERDEKVTAWLQEGSINAKEDITVGIENGPEAFVAMLRGENLGKAVLKIADPDL